MVPLVLILYVAPLDEARTYVAGVMLDSLTTVAVVAAWAWVRLVALTAAKANMARAPIFNANFRNFKTKTLPQLIILIMIHARLFVRLRIMLRQKCNIVIAFIYQHC